MKLRRRERSVPSLNMAAMPDLIFTVLFFFMIVTHMRQNTVQVTYREPQGKNLTKVPNKAGIIHVYVGKGEEKFGKVQKDEEKYKIQVNDHIVQPASLTQALVEARNEIPTDQLPYMTASLQADKDVPMQVITSIKQSLRQAKILKINYCGTEAE